MKKRPLIVILSFSTLILISTNILVCSIDSSPIKLDVGSVDEVTLTVLIDHYRNDSLTIAYGLSILVETANTLILFDTGPDPNPLQDNVEALGKDLSNINFTVISHHDLDHYGGMAYVAERKPNSSVYVPNYIAPHVKTSLTDLGFELIHVDTTTILSPGIAIVYTLPSSPEEISLAMNIDGVGTVLLVGCSHPGVENIVEEAVQSLGINPYLVIGGFHLLAEPKQTLNVIITELLELGIEKICPIHCTGETFRECMEEDFQDNFVNGCVGTTMVINEEKIKTEKISSNIFPAMLVIVVVLITRRKNKNIRKK